MVIVEHIVVQIDGCRRIAHDDGMEMKRICKSTDDVQLVIGWGRLCRT